MAVLLSAIDDSFGETQHLVELYVAFEAAHASQAAAAKGVLAAAADGVAAAAAPLDLDARAAALAKVRGYSERRALALLRSLGTSRAPTTASAHVRENAGTFDPAHDADDGSGGVE